MSQKPAPGDGFAPRPVDAAVTVTICGPRSIIPVVLPMPARRGRRSCAIDGRTKGADPTDWFASFEVFNRMEQLLGRRIA